MTNYSGQVPDILPKRGDWVRRAACAGEGIEVFFDDDFEPQAKALCARCPVHADCLSWIMGLEHGEAESTRDPAVVAGLNPNERTARDPSAPTPGDRPARRTVGTEKKPAKTKKQGRAKTEPAKCPSAAAYQRHVKRHEPIDDECRELYASERRNARNAARDAKVYALWSQGLSDLEICEQLKYAAVSVRRSRERLGLLANQAAVTEAAS